MGIYGKRHVKSNFRIYKSIKKCEGVSCIQKIAGILKSFRIQTPQKAPVLIFDHAGSEDLINLVLPGIHYSILHVRNEFFYMSPVILMMMINNFNYRALISGKKVISLIYQSYLYSITEYIQPYIVITYVDNHSSFQWLSRNYPNAQFFAIQNGMRNRYDLYTSLANPDGTIKKITMPHFVCFGQNDVDNYTRFGHQIDHFYCKGSLRGSYYQYCTPRTPEKKIYEICLVSHYSQDISDGNSFPGLKEASMEFFQLLKKYLEIHHNRTCVALRSSSAEEKKYYSDFFGDLVTIIPRNPNDFLPTYRAMDISEVIISLHSTAPLEAFGWGKKVLFCNFLEDYEIADFYTPGICSIIQRDYDSFEKSLSQLLLMDYDEFNQKTKDAQRYMMAYDPHQPVHEFIRKIITDLIASQTIDEASR